MKIKVFGKRNCAKCETVKNKIGHFLKKNECADKVSVEFQDMDTVEGMAEGAYYDVLKIPTSIFEKGGEIIARWDGEVPLTEDFRKYIE